jgi:hypothetical protein
MLLSAAQCAATWLGLVKIDRNDQATIINRWNQPVVQLGVAPNRFRMYPCC